MKIIVSILILTGILFQTTAKLLILVQFNANRAYIAKNLCVNRAKPKSCCKGSCQLNKKLKEEDRNERGGLPGNLKDKFELLLCTLTQKSEFVKQEQTSPSLFAFHNNYSFIFTTDHFHPPDHLSLKA